MPSQTFNTSDDARLFSRAVGGSISVIGGKYTVTYGTTVTGNNPPATNPPANNNPNVWNPASGVSFEQWNYDRSAKQSRAEAAGVLIAQFNAYGLSGISNLVQSFVNSSVPPALWQTKLKESKAYQDRFPAMAALAKAKKAMSESDYITQERAYDSVFSAAGIPGYAKSPKDYYFFFTNNISPEQVGNRVNAATSLINNSDPNALNAFQKFYGIGKKDLLAFYLSPKQQGPELIKKAQIAMTAGSAANFGVNVNEDFGRSIIDAGLASKAPEAFAKTAQTREELSRLASIGQGSITTDQIVEANLGMGTSSEKIVTGLASQERGRFSGKGTGTSMINQNVSGSY
jgi:hypothetical protein